MREVFEVAKLGGTYCTILLIITRCSDPHLLIYLVSYQRLPDVQKLALECESHLQQDNCCTL
jgi:hypothetical protein